MKEGGRAKGERMTEGWLSRDNGWKAGDQWARSLMEKGNQDTPMRRSLERESEKERERERERAEETGEGRRDGESTVGRRRCNTDQERH